ncbi:DUF1289 domain-containing protein [Veronia nyctiphanis]|uniref:DUF1289 domain-containing protein n=1 Tax=Veronia nyctiphanis TaxID=1278244 RepID=A0A4Q0YSC6_9GAMM|nr:cysteine-rich CWC family protein [Veronia nyctiphanis]RXJ74046.1 DUF1289 domain-containing protein [Veronia nyctiphanis]
MKSPCIGACKNQGGICKGCHRTMDEIVKWVQIGEEEREAIMDKLLGRMSTHACPECNEPMQCDISAGESSCWCFSLPTRDVSDSADSSVCLCRKCLSKKALSVSY